MRLQRAPQRGSDDTASCRPVGTLVAVLVVIALGWAFLLCGFLPGAVGDAWRRFLLSNPRNPSIGLAFLPAMAVIPIVLVLRHGGTKRAIAVIVAGSYLLAVAMEWMMRRAVHSWAPLDQPPFNMPLWTAHRLTTLFIIVTAVGLVAASWRRAADRPKDRAAASGGRAAA
jgi:hypothetical protein